MPRKTKPAAVASSPAPGQAQDNACACACDAAPAPASERAAGVAFSLSRAEWLNRLLGLAEKAESAEDFNIARATLREIGLAMPNWYGPDEGAGGREAGAGNGGGSFANFLAHIRAR